MRRRFHVSWHESFADAHVAKVKLLLESPDKDYQVRKRSREKTRGFAVVERITTSESKVVEGLRNGVSKRKGRRKPAVL